MLLREISTSIPGQKLFVLSVFILISTLATVAQPAEKNDVQASQAAQAEWLATGGSAWDAVAAVEMDGTITQGGAPGTFKKTMDWKTGYTRMDVETGPMKQMSGFDGTAWSSQNGIVSFVDLPAFVEDARSQTFLDRAGWRTEKALSNEPSQNGLLIAHYHPTGCSEVGVSFDVKSHLVTQAVVETNGGPLTITYSDWRPVGKVKFPFHQVQRDSVGETIVLEVQRVRLQNKVDPSTLARPVAVPRGHLLSGSNAPVPFTFIGSHRSHILVRAKVSGVDAKLVFDTGAANYFSPESAKRFGLAVSGGVNLSGIGESSMTGGYAKADKISIGVAELKDQTVTVGPMPGANPQGQQDAPDGLAGFEFLAEFRTTIDYPAQTITFRDFSQPPVAGGVKVPFLSDGQHIYVEAEASNARGLFLLDTGDGGTVTLLPTFAKTHGLDKGLGGNVVLPGGIGGQISVKPLTLSNFVLAGTQFHDLPAKLSQNTKGPFASRTIAGNLGAGLLRCFRITIDFPARVLTFESVAGCH